MKADNLSYKSSLATIETPRSSTGDFTRAMTFEDIPFRDRPGTMGQTTGILLGGHWILRWQVEFAWRQLLLNLPSMNLSVQRTTKFLLQDDSWASRKIGVRIGLGRCVRYFVVNRMIPLRLANPGKKGPRKYLRMDT